MTSSRDEIFETQADPDSRQRTARMHERTLDDSRTHANERAAQRLGPYRLVRELARGGMGAVFEVVDERDGRQLALKTIRADMTDPESLDRFRREAQLTAQLDHPNVCRLHHANLDHDPCYLVQDLLTGGTLEQRLRAGPLPPEEARQIALDLGEGLAHAHGLGILHRDLSPRNVMFDAAGSAKIVDFGLARSLATWQRLTVTGQLLGTPAFMAPEQALDSKSADARSDVYGLGGLLYTMLTGAALIPPEARTIPAAVEALLHWTPPSARSLNPQVPADLDAICQRALAKDPLRRFSSMRAMVRALAAEPGAAPVEVDGEPAQRGKWPLALAGVLGVAVLLGLGYLVGRTGPTPAEPPIASASSALPEPNTTGPAPAPTATPTAAFTAPGAKWRLKVGQTLEYQLTRWLERDQPALRASLALLVQLKVLAIEEERVRLEGRVLRVRYWIDGPYTLRFDSNRPRVTTDPRGEAQRSLLAPVGVAFPVELNPLEIGSVRVGPNDLGARVLERVPERTAAYDRGWAVRRLAESLQRRALAVFFRGPRLRFEQGRVVANHRESNPREGREIERLRLVRVHRVSPKEVLTKISEHTECFLGRITARNRIEAPNLIRVGDVLELPPPEPVAQRLKLVSLVRGGNLPPLVVARPWGAALAVGNPGWSFAQLGEEGVWVQIQWGGGAGWVRRRDTAPASPAARAYRVKATGLWVRSQPGMGDNQLGMVGKAQIYVGDPARIQNRFWIPIRFDEREPFVSVRFLTPLQR